MNLLEALEKKKALESILEDKLESLSNHLNDVEEMTLILTSIDSTIDNVFSLGRKVDILYNNTLVSKTESISDVISYVDGLTKKINVLRYLLLAANKYEIETSEKTSVSAVTLLNTIQHYESLKNSLVTEIRTVCLKTELI